MGVDHRRGHVLVAEQLLDGADVVARLRQVRREGVAERVATHMLDNAGPADSLLDRPLHQGLMKVMPPLFARL